MRKLLQEFHTSQNDISLQPSSTRSNFSEAFIPFVNERDHLGRLITNNRKKGQVKNQFLPSKENIYPSKKQLLCRLYEDSLTTRNLKEIKTNTLTPQLANDCWKSEDIFPKVKRSEPSSLNEIRTNRSQYKIRNENNVVAASSRDNLSQGGASSMESFNTERIQGKQIKKKSKTLVLKEERRFETTESMLERLFGKEIKENKPELMLPSLLLAKTKTPANGNVKKEPLKKIELKKNVEMKAKSMIPSKDSAAMFVENRSYFRKLKAEEDEEKYLQFHNTMDSKFVEMREKLNLLKNAINK